MRKLNYGLFYDKYLTRPSCDDGGMIGAHSSSRRAHIENKESEGYEFYYLDENKRIHIVDDATLMEKLRAIIIGRKSTRKFIGFRELSIYDEDLKQL